ncbi:MAG TPA: hypothetical protein VHX40_08700, partial [Acidimicrobiales bacterium]|nr:hypothetical protein [Acidimicrobiales bacterium]
GSLLVQIAGVALAVGGVALLVVTRSRWHRWLAVGAPGGHPGSGTDTEPTVGGGGGGGPDTTSPAGIEPAPSPGAAAGHP